MPIFLWLNVVRAYDFDQEAIRRTARRSSRDEREHEGLSRVRWQERYGAERSFPCGLVLVPESEGAMTRSVRPPPAVPPLPPPGEVSSVEQPPAPVPPPSEAASLLRPAEVTAVVLPADLAFLFEDGEGDVEEGGRVPRTAILDVDVIDERGDHVPEPVHETIEPSRLVFTVLRWSNESAPDEDRFAFRSPWLAWTAGRKLMEARRG